MLVLHRQLNEDVYIDTPGGERVLVRVVAINGHKGVKIGFEAPRAFAVHRREIAERIEELREQATIAAAVQKAGPSVSQAESQIGSEAR